MDRNMIFITIQTKGHPSQSRHNEINEILAKKIIRDLNLDSKKLRITSSFKNKLEILVYQAIIQQSTMKNLQIKKIHLHFEVKNSKSTSKTSNFATQFVSKENAIFFG